VHFFRNGQEYAFRRKRGGSRLFKFTQALFEQAPLQPIAGIDNKKHGAVMLAAGFGQ
jgi:hypothetical protein